MFLLEESCLQGWFPCSETFTGNLFLVLVYALILAFASKLIAEGSELLMEVRLSLMKCSFQFRESCLANSSSFSLAEGSWQSWNSRRTDTTCAWCFTWCGNYCCVVTRRHRWRSSTRGMQSIFVTFVKQSLIALGWDGHPSWKWRAHSNYTLVHWGDSRSLWYWSQYRWSYRRKVFSLDQCIPATTRDHTLFQCQAHSCNFSDNGIQLCCTFSSQPLSLTPQTHPPKDGYALTVVFRLFPSYWCK